MELDKLTSVATSFGAKRVCDQALPCAASHPVINVLVSDQQVIYASLACVYGHIAELTAFQNVLVIVYSSVTITVEQLLALSETRRIAIKQPGRHSLLIDLHARCHSPQGTDQHRLQNLWRLVPVPTSKRTKV